VHGILDPFADPVSCESDEDNQADNSPRRTATLRTGRVGVAVAVAGLIGNIDRN